MLWAQSEVQGGKSFLVVRVVKLWHRLTGELVESPSSEKLKTQQDTALSNLLQLPRAGFGLDTLQRCLLASTGLCLLNKEVGNPSFQLLHAHEKAIPMFEDTKAFHCLLLFCGYS